jgi:peptidyl-prolyl cis-trans isomerase C
MAGATITVEDFEIELGSLPEYTQKRMNTGEQKKKHLDKMIDEILLLAEAEKRGLDRDAEIQRKVERYRRRLITERLYREVAKEKSRVGDEEIQEYFQAHRDRFMQKERIRVRQILVLLPPNAGPEKEAEAKKKAEEILRRAKSGEDFAGLAKEYSEGPAASRGGDLGFFSRGRMVPAFEEAAFALEKEGDTSDVVQTKFGYHIIQLAGRQPAKELSIDEVRDRIVRQLESARRREVRQSLAKELREQADVEIREGYFEEEAPGKDDDPDA